MPTEESNAETRFRTTVKLFLFILALSFLALVQVDNEFKAINKVFSIKKFEKPEISFRLEKEETFQIQVAHRVAGKEPVTTSLILFINDKKAKELQFNGTGTQKKKFAVSQSFFTKGENRIAWELTPSRPGVFVDEIKLTNYVGINPNIPVAWVVPDEFISQHPARGAYQFLTIFFCVTLAVALYMTLNRLLYYNSLQESLSACRKFLFAPNLALCAILFYSIFTPQKILFPTETALWLILLCSLAIQFPCILIACAMGKSRSSNKTGIMLTVICLISVLAHLSYFKNAWYVQDDYVSIHAGIDSSWYMPNSDAPGKFGQTDKFTSILESTNNIIKWLYEGQGRYQPVRLYIFMAFMHFFQEEHNPYYNFALHLANLALLFLLLRKFKAEPAAILISVLLFSLFGRWRMMESPSTMIAGSGLNFFLISLTLLFLIKALESGDTPARKTVFFSISWFFYFCLVFSYEVAFPLILPIIYIFFNFSGKQETGREPEKSASWFATAIMFAANLFKRRDIFYLAPYFILLSVYILFFKLPAKGTYPGTTISWNLADIWTRLMHYADHTVSLRINLNYLGAADIIILFLYYAVAAMCAKSPLPASAQKQNNRQIIFFSLAFYFSSMILFTLNSWESPDNIMIHHTYMMTVGASILTVFLLFQAQWFLPGATFLAKSNSRRAFATIFLQKHYRNFLIFIFFPLVLVSEGGYISRYYTIHDVGTAFIKPIKTGVLKYIDPENTDAVIIKNFHHNYHGISSMDGALMQWFNFKRLITAGREVLSADHGKIVFMRPLGYYWPHPHMRGEVINQRSLILFLENKTLLPYYDFIHFEGETNLHQTRQVWGDQEPEEFRHYRVDAILKNSKRGDFLEIRARSEEELEMLATNTTRLEVNGKLISRVLTSGESLFIDISSEKTSSNYFFLTLVSTDIRLKKHLQLIRLQNPEGDTVSRNIENIPIGADSWGIG